MIFNLKNREQALLRILACQIIATAEIKDPESHQKMTDNLAELAFLAGGVEGMKKITDTLEKRSILDQGTCPKCGAAIGPPVYVPEVHDYIHDIGACAYLPLDAEDSAAVMEQVKKGMAEQFARDLADLIQMWRFNDYDNKMRRYEGRIRVLDPSFSYEGNKNSTD